MDPARWVPAHTGGADLSSLSKTWSVLSPVPAHTGGADLSWRAWRLTARISVPAHTGGADLSKIVQDVDGSAVVVPAHTGGADLSKDIHFKLIPPLLRPRPHGRGGFKSGC